MADPKNTEGKGPDPKDQGARRIDAAQPARQESQAGAAPSRGTPAPAAGAPPAAQSGPNGSDAGAGEDGSSGVAVGTRRRRYLMAVRPSPGLAPAAADMLHGNLNDLVTKTEGIQVVKRIKSSQLNVFSTGPGGATPPEIIVAEMDYDQGERLRAQASANPSYIVEVDHQLQYQEGVAEVARSAASTGFLGSPGPALDVRLRVTGTEGTPLANAIVYVYGPGLPAQGTTDANGDVSVTVYGGSIASIKALYVKPAADHWEQFVLRPAMNPDGATLVQLQPLSSTFPGFPQTGFVGWGQKLMGLDAIGPNLTGRGVRIGIIDSGCDNTHPQLTHLQNGKDFTDGGTDASWTTDTVSHGTHCAGVITASSKTLQGIRGFAPEAEVHSFKVFPGGRFSSLIDALDECIAREIDVVNMSLGSDQASELVTRKIQEAIEHGVALIIAAGNSGGPVQFPGNLPHVLTVAAVGELNQYPADTNHAQDAMPGGIGDVFPAKFSCFGPQVGVCGPGVAIVSTVPGGGYAAWDGTSMATPHITGLAALVLAHHPTFQGGPKQRNIGRVAQLYQILQAASAPCVLDVQRGGAGLPNAVAIFGRAAAQQSPAVQTGAPAQPIRLPEAAQSAGPGNIPAGALGGYGQQPAQQPSAYAGQQQAWSGYVDPAIIQALAIAQLRAMGLPI